MTMDRTRAAGSQSRPAGSWPRFAGALLVLAVIAVGIPIGLIAASRIALGSSQPLPGIGSWDDIRSWISTQRSSTEIARVALRVLLALAWLLWAALLVSVVSSLVASRPKLEHVHIPRLAMFDGLGTWIVAGLLVFGSLTPKVAAASPPSAASRSGRVRQHAPRQRRRLLEPRSRHRHGRAGPSYNRPSRSRCSPRARLATPAVGPRCGSSTSDRQMDQAGTTWSEAWRLNAGWELQLPAVAPTPSTRRRTGAAAPRHRQRTHRRRPAAVHRIVYGDTLWDILKAHYGYVDARPGQLRRRLQRDRRSVEHPDRHRRRLAGSSIRLTRPSPAPPAVATPAVDPSIVAHTVRRGGNGVGHHRAPLRPGRRHHGRNDRRLQRPGGPRRDLRWHGDPAASPCCGRDARSAPR